MVTQKAKISKIFVLDTNVLIHDPKAVLSFDDNEVVIPLTIIEELDDKKRGNGEIPHSAREALRQIDKFRNGGNIAKGIKLPNGGTLKTVLASKVNKNLRDKKNDNFIISTALKIQEGDNKREVIFISKDTAARIKAEAVGLKAEDYRKDKTSLFQNYGKVLYDGDYENGISSTRYKVEKDALFRIYADNLIQPVKRKCSVFEISPKNIEQECALNALTNPAVEIVALTGNAGSGKTLLSLAAALQQTTKSSPLFSQILVARPVIPMGGRDNDIGFLPGTKSEKLEPWMQPIFDNLEVLIRTPKHSKDGVNSDKYRSYQYLIESGVLQVEALAYIRGRSLPRRYFIVDESQNLRPLDVKTLLTRCGEGTKIVFTGDLDQIDTPYLDKQSNGLAYLIDRYINEPEFCYLHMQKSARSAMADKASRLL